MRRKNVISPCTLTFASREGKLRIYTLFQAPKMLLYGLLVGYIYDWVKSQNFKFDAPHGGLVGITRHLVKKKNYYYIKKNKPRNPSAQNLKIQWKINIDILKY